MPINILQLYKKGHYKLFDCRNTLVQQLGNHRAVVQVDEPAKVVGLDLIWRRHDKNPKQKKFIIIYENGDTIQNIQRIQIDKEQCHLNFGPVKQSGKYYFYYLPYEVQ